MTLKGFHLDEAKKLVGVILGAEEHLGTVQNIGIRTSISKSLESSLDPLKNPTDF